MMNLTVICMYICFIAAPILEANEDGYCPKTDSDRECCESYHYVNGQCLRCPAGSFGKNCSEECPELHYGDLCVHICYCSSNESCDKVKGCVNVFDNTTIRQNKTSSVNQHTFSNLLTPLQWTLLLSGSGGVLLICVVIVSVKIWKCKRIRRMNKKQLTGSYQNGKHPTVSTECCCEAKTQNPRALPCKKCVQNFNDPVYIAPESDKNTSISFSAGGYEEPVITLPQEPNGSSVHSINEYPNNASKTANIIADGGNAIGNMDTYSEIKSARSHEIHKSKNSVNVLSGSKSICSTRATEQPGSDKDILGNASVRPHNKQDNYTSIHGMGERNTNSIVLDIDQKYTMVLPKTTRNKSTENVDKLFKISENNEERSHAYYILEPKKRSTLNDRDISECQIDIENLPPPCFDDFDDLK